MNTLHYIYSLVLFSSILLFCPINVQAQSGNGQLYPGYNEETFMDMDFDPNLLTPEVPAAARNTIADYMRKTANSMKSAYIIDLMRDDEVLIVSIPTDEVFLPNDTLLSEYASKQLDPLLRLMSDPYMYKIVVAVHTDDTGSEHYRDMLSTARLNSIYDWFMDEIDAGKLSEDLIIIPFSMASSDPIQLNDTRAHRRENRRLEFYFIPGPKMIDLALKRQLK